MSLQLLNFHNVGGVIEDHEETKETKFEKYGAYHKTNIVFMLDLTSDMMRPSQLTEKKHGAVPLSYACLLAIREAIIDIMKHSSLGGGGRDRVAILGLMHNKTVVLLEMQLPSAKTLEVVDCLLKVLRHATPKEGNHMLLGKAFDVAFSFLKDLQGDGQIFICTLNDDPCEKTKKQRGVSEETVVLGKAADLTRNHHISIKLLVVPQCRAGGCNDDAENAFDMSKFWCEIVSDHNPEEQGVIESLSDLARNIRALIRPTALTAPSGSRLKLRIRCAPDEQRKEMSMHVNLYALSRSRNFNPGRSFKVDVDDGHFLVEAKVRDGKVHHASGDVYEGHLDDSSPAPANGEEDFDFDEQSATGTRPQAGEGTYVKKKALPLFESDLKQWSMTELKDVVKHDRPRTVDILGFIPQTSINTEFRGQSPQYMTLAKGSDSEAEEWWATLWHCCRKLDVACLALLYLRETNSPKQILLYAHSAYRDRHGSLQLPNGFYIHYLPYRDRVYVEIQPPSSTDPPKPNPEVASSIEACLRHISKRSFTPVRDEKSACEWRVLEALALDKAPPDFTQPTPVYPDQIMRCMRKLKATLGPSDNVVEPPKSKRPKQAALKKS